MRHVGDLSSPRWGQGRGKWSLLGLNPPFPGAIWARSSLVCRRWIFSEIFTFSLDVQNVPATLKGWSFSEQTNTFQVYLSWQSAGLIAVAHGISCSVACGILPDQGLNPCFLHWQVDSLPLSHPGSLQGLLLKLRIESARQQGGVGRERAERLIS